MGPGLVRRAAEPSPKQLWGKVDYKDPELALRILSQPKQSRPRRSETQGKSRNFTKTGSDAFTLAAHLSVTQPPGHSVSGVRGPRPGQMAMTKGVRGRVTRTSRVGLG